MVVYKTLVAMVGYLTVRIVVTSPDIASILDLFERIQQSFNYHTYLEEEYANYRKPPEGLDDFLCGRIIGRQECGRTQLEVYEELGIAQSVISRFWQ
ncbi:uncharacterized protein TNCV_2408241 [Trichonephila clavipes]|nr:uncharacterized protein TNCV_2408241 [Trichonephila clavipes]